MTKIALCLSLSTSQIARLKSGIGECELVPGGDLSGCEIAFGNPAPSALKSANSLRWLQLESVGFGEYLRLNWAAMGDKLTVTNLAGMFADPAAETALAGILALERSVDRLIALQAEQKWIGDTVRTKMRLLKGSRVVLFGRGSINGRLEELLTPFRCRVTSFGRDWTTDMLDEALSEADVVVSTVPDTPATRGLFDAERFAKIKLGAIFCNMGRGSLVDEAALAEVLNNGRLGGAVIDVTQQEPLPDVHALWTTPNTVLTQHSGGGTSDELDRKIDWFLDNFNQYSNHQPLNAVVNFDRGY